MEKHKVTKKTQPPTPAPKKKPTTRKEQGDRVPIKPLKDEVFNLYLLWLSLPFKLKGADQKELDKWQIQDQTVRDMAKLKTKSAFAKKYKVDNATLSKWSKTKLAQDVLQANLAWMKGLASNVDSALYKGAMGASKTASQDRKLFYQRMGWMEGQILKHGMDEGLAEIMNKARHAGDEDA